MSFPKLIPAFSVKIPIIPTSSIGSAKTGGLNHVLFVPIEQGHGGSFESEPGYEIAVDAQFLHGGDYIRPDPDGKHLRLSVNSVLKDAGNEDAFLTYNYTGIITLTPEIGKVLTGAADAATTPFGYVFSHVNLESGHPSLEALEHKVFVGSGRFVVEPGQPVVVEYKISEVAA